MYVPVRDKTVAGEIKTRSVVIVVVVVVKAVAVTMMMAILMMEGLPITAATVKGIMPPSTPCVIGAVAPALVSVIQMAVAITPVIIIAPVPAMLLAVMLPVVPVMQAFMHAAGLLISIMAGLVMVGVGPLPFSRIHGSRKRQ
jgi:hypothetical protein